MDKIFLSEFWYDWRINNLILNSIFFLLIFKNYLCFLEEFLIFSNSSTVWQNRKNRVRSIIIIKILMNYRSYHIYCYCFIYSTVFFDRFISMNGMYECERIRYMYVCRYI